MALLFSLNFLYFKLDTNLQSKQFRHVNIKLRLQIMYGLLRCDIVKF